MITGKKGFNQGAILQLVMFLVMIGVFISVGAMIVSDMQDDMTVDTAEHNATTQTLASFQNVSDWLPIVGLIIAAVIVITIIMLLKNVY